jgi:formiminotetrahydrofolate cyclodeaminase
MSDTTPYGELTLADFSERLASGAPVPGGGSASAVAASLGASLVAMVAALSEDRPKYAQHAALHASAGRAGRDLAALLLRLADEDSEAYAGFGAAMKLPRETDDEKAVRQAAIRAAARAAAEVPLRCVEACLGVVVLSEALAGRSNVNASSDLNVASLLAEAGARGAAANVLVNLPAVGDDAWSAATHVRVRSLLDEVTALAEATRTAVASGEPREPRDQIEG